VPSLGLYAASKAFVLSLTESLAEELRGSGVTVTALCPGLTKTEMVEDIHGALQVPAFMMASAEAVAREGYAALMSGEVVRVPGLANVAAITWAKFQPRWLVRNLGGLAARLTA
jgi:short-subunit dehydrogenase